MDTSPLVGIDVINAKLDGVISSINSLKLDVSIKRVSIEPSITKGVIADTNTLMLEYSQKYLGEFAFRIFYTIFFVEANYEKYININTAILGL